MIWVHSPEEAQHAVTRPTQLWERWRGRHRETLPFGLCLRPQQSATKALPFAAFDYTPAYLLSPWVIHIAANATVLTEPMLFYMTFGGRPDQAETPSPLEHEIGFREITSVQIQSPHPTPPSDTLGAVVEMGIVTVKPGASALIETSFDGEAQGRSMDFQPDLPLVLHW
ncbi:hypothetical protein C2W62_41260 [Candidatus Entotheonella serta]|nr:hypothetical protein C2W62_41260 [Candidatus Entotheonella serta]